MKTLRWKRKESILDSTFNALLTGALLILPSLVWYLRDESVWSWDPSWYGEVATRLWFVLTQKEFLLWLEEMVNAFGTKAPGVAWFGQFFVPIGVAVNSVEVGLLFSIWFTQLLTLSLIFDASRSLSDGSIMAGILAAGLTASAPLFVALSHSFFAEPLQLCAVTYAFWIAARSREMGFFRLLAHSVVAVSVGMLAKATYPLYTLGPGLIISWRLYTIVKNGEIETRKLPLFLLVGSGALLTMCCIWYARNLGTVISFIKLASSSEIALDYGSQANIITKLRYWSGALKFSFTADWTGLILLFVFLFALCINIRSKKKEAGWSISFKQAFLCTSFFQILFVLLVFSLNINEETRYLLPIIPAFAILIALNIVSAQSRVMVYSALLILLMQYTIVHSYSQGMTVNKQGITYHLKPVTTDPAKRREVEKIIDETSRHEHANRMSITGIELPWFNANTLSFFAQKQALHKKFRVYYTSLGYAETDPEKAWNRLQTLRAIYFITMEYKRHPRPPNFLNRISLPIQQRIEASQQFSQEQFDSKFGIVVYKRTES